MKILVLEDHQDCITLYEDILGKDHNLVIITSLKELESQLKLSRNFDLFLSDLKLPDGFFLDWVVQHKSAIMENVPTVIVSSNEDLETLRTSFEWGASDYLIKPFRKSELLAKVEKALRHYTVKPGVENTQEVMDGLTLIEAKIFQQLLNHPGNYLPRDKIISGVWKKVMVSAKTLDVHLSNLRKKLADTAWSIDYEGAKGWRLVKKT